MVMTLLLYIRFSFFSIRMSEVKVSDAWINKLIFIIRLEQRLNWIAHIFCKPNEYCVEEQYHEYK